MAPAWLVKNNVPIKKVISPVSRAISSFSAASDVEAMMDVEEEIGQLQMMINQSWSMTNISTYTVTAA